MGNRSEIITGLHACFGVDKSQFESMKIDELRAYVVGHYSLVQRFYLMKKIKELK